MNEEEEEEDFSTHFAMHNRSSVCPINRARETFGEYHHLFTELKEDSIKFKQYLRMKLDTFIYILSKIEPHVRKNWGNFHVRPILAEERLVLTLRFLATGLTFTQLSLAFRMGISTVQNIVKETMDILWTVLSPIHMPIPTRDMFLQISERFYAKSGMPNCIGAIDGRHVRIRRPNNSHAKYFNYKKYYSISYQAVVDADYKYICIDVGACGSQSDGGVFRYSTLKKALSERKLQIPSIHSKPQNIDANIRVPYFFVGDGAYPLSSHLMKPFPGVNLSREKVLFNKNLSRARAVVENAFGHTCQKWRIFYTTIQTSPQMANKIVESACILHNVIIDMEGDISNLRISDRVNRHLTPLQRGNCILDEENTGQKTREKLMRYFSL